MSPRAFRAAGRGGSAVSVALGDASLDPRDRIPRLDFELTPGCDHRCAHCYNVWTAEDGDAQAGYDTSGQLRTAELLALMTKAVRQTGARHLTLTGGEPLLRKDAMRIVEHACTLSPSVTIITNGSHVGAERAKRLKEIGVSSVQLTLLAADRETHDRLKGAECFDDTVRAALDLTEARVPVQVCFVAMKENAPLFRDVLELCYVLGVRFISYNRMSPTGGAIHHIARLLPDIDDIEANLDVAETLGAALGVHVSTAMPIPPCLLRIDRFQWVKFGFCSTGSHSPNVVIDAAGNVRSCNLSSKVLGNLAEQDWSEIFANPYPTAFRRAVPQMCQGCAYETTCIGGCGESAFATFGDRSHPDPLVWMTLDPDWRTSIEREVAQAVIPLRRLVEPRP
jgi:pyrroloquinoline quinone biosynthesis protein E